MAKRKPKPNTKTPKVSERRHLFPAALQYLPELLETKIAKTAYQPSERRTRWTGFPIPIVTCGVGLIGNIVLVLATWKVFWFIPAGTIIDLMMGFSGLVFMVAVGTAVIGVALGILGLSCESGRRACCWMIALLRVALSPTLVH